MPTKLQVARAQQAAAKAATAARFQAKEQARAALEAAPVPEGSTLADMAEYQALREAGAAYDEAVTDEAAADDLVSEAVALLGEDGAAPKAKAFDNVRAITGQFGPEETFGFKNVGEFIAAVAFNPGELAKRGVEFKAEVSTKGDNTEGGFELPALFLDRILEAPTTRAIVRSHNPMIIGAGDMPDAELKMRALNQVGAGNMYGGVEVFWEDEEDTDDGSPTEGKTDFVTVQANSVRAFITETNKFLRNAGSAAGLMERLLGNALVGSEDTKFLSGAAIDATPTGVRNCAGMIYINRTSANTVVLEDVLAMVQALHPDSLSRAVWVASQSLMSVLWNIKDAEGNRAYITGDPSKAISDTLFGIPVEYTGKVGAKGAKGDLILCDFSYYLIKEGLSPLISASSHVKFMKDRTVIKINRSVDGKGWLTGPLTLEDGVTTVSPFVGLDVPEIGS